MKELLVKETKFRHIKVFSYLVNNGTGNSISNQNPIDIPIIFSGSFGVFVKTPVFLSRFFNYNFLYGGVIHGKNNYNVRFGTSQDRNVRFGHKNSLGFNNISLSNDKLLLWQKRQTLPNPPNYMSEFKDRLKLLRTVLGLSQAEMARKLGIARSRLSELESGKTKPRDSLLRLISKTFGVSYEWLKYGKGEMWEQKEEEIPPDAPLDRELFYKIMTLIVKAIREGKLIGISDEELLELVKLLYKKYKPLKDKEESEKLWKELEQDVVILGKTLEKR